MSVVTCHQPPLPRTGGPAPLARDRGPRPVAADRALTVEPWGERPDGRRVERWTMTNGEVTARVLTHGGILQSLEVPDHRGRVRNVVLGFADLRGYLEGNDPGPRFGAITGRYANRTAGRTYVLDGVERPLPLDDGRGPLPGGACSFGRRLWNATPVTDGGRVGVRLTLDSPHGDQGLPGHLRVEVAYTLDRFGQLSLDTTATTDAATVVNITNRSHWNLAGEGRGGVLDHELTLHADRYSPLGPTLAPTGDLAPVAGTPLDFRQPTRIGARIRKPSRQLLLARGYDHNWVLDRSPGAGLEEVAVLHDPRSGRTLRIATTEPGLQFTSGNHLDGTLVGTGGGTYRQGDGLALEPQHLPTTTDGSGSPSTVLRPGQVHRSTTVYALSHS